MQSYRDWNITSIPAVCITMERRTDRWKRFQDQPGIRGLTLQRFLAVDGKTLDVKTDTRITTLAKRNILTKSRRSHEEIDSIGAVGCSLSHIAVWQSMVDKKQELCLVFEDDAMIPFDFIEQANKCIKESLLQNPTQWDIWLLGGIWDDTSSIPNEKTVMRVGAFMLSHAYVITLRTAKKLVEDAYPIHCHIDGWMSVYSYMNDIRLVGTNQLHLKQNPKSSTDIQSEEGCAICNVPTEFTKDYAMISKADLYIARASEIGLFILIVYLVLKNK
jgi:glycosyl transferase family 25